MNTHRFPILFAFLLMAGMLKTQAQDTTNLFAAESGKVITLSQDDVPDYSEWLYYDDGNYDTNLGFMPEGIPFSWAVAFPASMLQPYEGHILTKVSLFENDWNMGDLRLSIYYGESYMPRTLMAEQIVTPLCEWWFHEIELETPVDIDTTQYLWVVFSELAVTETYSAACSKNRIDPNPNARWVQYEENKWMDAGDAGFPCVQFMIRAYVTDPWGIEKPLSGDEFEVYPNPGGNTLNIRTGLQNARVEVYDVNGKLIHSQEIKDATTSINSENWILGTYIWKVVSNGKEAETGKWIKQ